MKYEDAGATEEGDTQLEVHPVGKEPGEKTTYIKGV